MMSAYLDASLDPEFRRIILIDGPAVVGYDPETEAAAAQQPGMQARSRTTTCGATSSLRWRTATAASPSTFRSARTPGPCTKGPTARPPHWPG